MAKNASIPVGTTPTLLYQADGPNVETVTLDNAAGSDVTLGGSGVVAGAGPQLKAANPPQTMALYEDSIYGICGAAGAATVEVLAVLSGSR